MEKETPEIAFFPSGLMRVSLYLYFAVILMYSIFAADLYGYEQAPMHHQENFAFLFAAYIGILCYSLTVMIAFLKGRPYSVISMQISIILMLLLHVTACSPILAYRHVPSFPFALLYLFVIALLLFLLFHVRHAKCVREGIPKKSRRFGIVGWIGTALSIYLASVVIWPFAQVMSGSLFREEIAFAEGEVSDSLIAFRPADGWRSVSGTEDDKEFVFETDNGGTIKIRSAIIQSFSRLSFAAEMSECFPDSCCIDSYPTEYHYSNESFDGNTLYMSTYMFENEGAEEDDDAIMYWTFAILKCGDGLTGCVLSILEPNEYCGDEAIINFMKNVRFPLEQ